MLTHAATTAYAASLQGCDGASEANVEGTPPSFSELLAQTPPEHLPASRLPPPATLLHFATWGQTRLKTVNLGLVALLGTGQTKNCLH